MSNESIPNESSPLFLRMLRIIRTGFLTIMGYNPHTPLNRWDLFYSIFLPVTLIQNLYFNLSYSINLRTIYPPFLPVIAVILSLIAPLVLYDWYRHEMARLSYDQIEAWMYSRLILWITPILLFFFTPPRVILL